MGPKANVCPFMTLQNSTVLGKLRVYCVVALQKDRRLQEHPKAAQKKPEQKGMKVTHISNKDLPEEPLRMGRASPELLHKLSWALVRDV